MMKRIRIGISELLAITIGIAITIAIGVMLYTFMPNFISTAVQQQRIGVTVISASTINNSAATISLAIKNLGTKAIKEVEVSTIGLTIAQVLTGTPKTDGSGRIVLNLSNKPLHPGQELPLVLVVRGERIHSGTKVDIIILAKFIDESAMSTSISVTVI